LAIPVPKNIFVDKMMGRTATVNSHGPGMSNSAMQGTVSHSNSASFETQWRYSIKSHFQQSNFLIHFIYTNSEIEAKPNKYIKEGEKRLKEKNNE